MKAALVMSAIVLMWWVPEKSTTNVLPDSGQSITLNHPMRINVWTLLSVSLLLLIAQVVLLVLVCMDKQDIGTQDTEATEMDSESKI